MPPVSNSRRGRRRGGDINPRRPPLALPLPMDNFNLIDTVYLRRHFFPEPVEVVDLTNVSLR